MGNSVQSGNVIWRADSAGAWQGHLRKCSYPQTLEIGVGVLKLKPELNPNRPNCRSIRVFGFDSYMCYISEYGFKFGS
jgi:hypothetical protein